MNGFTPLETNIEIGKHTEAHFLGMTFNMDTIWSTVIAGLVVILLGFIARRALTRTTKDHVPTKVQLIWETVVGQVNSQVEENIGRVHPILAPLAIALFFFILVANYLEIIPSDFGAHRLHFLPAPTADPNLTYAMGIMALVGAWIYGIRKQGVGAYLKGFTQPMWPLTPLNIIEELVKPFTLALRLFGNIFAGGIMILIIGLLVAVHPAHVPVGSVFTVLLNVVWKLFDMFIGAIQAFIFALLTVIYFAMAGSGHGGGDHEEHDHQTNDDKSGAVGKTPTASPELAA